MTLLGVIASLLGKGSDAPPPQIEAEKEIITNARPIELGPPVGRCNWCGRLARRLTVVEVVNGQERAKGECCGG